MSVGRIGMIVAGLIALGLIGLALILLWGRPGLLWGADTRRLDWLPSETAPVDRPVYVVTGDFILPDGSRIYIPDQRVARTGWGRTGSIHIVEPALKPLPVAVEATWYGLSERQAYRGRADLPVDLMAELFGTAVPDPRGGSAEKPDRLVLGMAPGGDMAVWAVGINATVLLGMYAAQPVELSNAEVFQTDEPISDDLYATLLEESLPKADLDRLALTGPLPGLWREFDTRYGWMPRVETGPAVAFQLRALNGEVEWMAAEPSAKDRAAPERMDVYWRQGPHELVAEVKFDIAETRALFASFAPDAPLEVVFAPDAAGRAIEIALTDGSRQARFEKATAAIYTAR